MWRWLVVGGVSLSMLSCAEKSLGVGADKSAAPAYEIEVQEKKEEAAATGNNFAPAAPAAAAMAPPPPAAKAIGAPRRPAPKPRSKSRRGPGSRNQLADHLRSRQRNARKVVAKRTIAGALMGKGEASKLFAEGGKFGGDDHDDDGGLQLKGAGQGGGGAIDGLKRKKERKNKGRYDKAGFRGKDRISGKEDAGYLDKTGDLEAPEEDVSDEEETTTAQRPASFLPRMCYFENTYLGGNAAYLERLRRLSKTLTGADKAWMKARAAVAQVDPPTHAAMGLSATLDRRSIEGPGRVWLQVGLRGSRRYGWRRPPLDVAVVITHSALVGTADALERTRDTLRQLARRLGPQDRVEVRIVGRGDGIVVQEAIAASDLRLRVSALLSRIDSAVSRSLRGAAPMRQTLAAAGESLVALSDNPHRVPGTRLVLLVTGTGRDSRNITAAQQAAHALQLRGAVTSVLSVDDLQPVASDSGWWQVANAGHGNFHRVSESGAKKAVQTELDTLSRVVARLLRINIRLGRHSNAVRILGSKVLKQREVARVKAREKRIDNALSKSMGVSADRGDDDDGIQTVIPYFYGDDSHVLLIELWVDKPGAVADITLRYKDLVNLDNATERVSVSLSAIPRRPTPAQREVHANVNATRLALSLGDAWRAADQGNLAAMPALEKAEKAAKSAADQGMVRGLKKLIMDNRVAPAQQQRAVRDALRMARDRKIGHSGL